MPRTRNTQQTQQGLKWEDYVKSFFCNNGYVAQPCMVLKELLDLCSNNKTKNTLMADQNSVLRKLFPQIKVGKQDITNSVIKEIKKPETLSLSRDDNSIKDLVEKMIDQIKNKLDEVVQNIVSGSNLNKDNVRKALETQLLRTLEGTCLFRKIEEFNKALVKMKNMINACCGVVINSPKDLICPLILLYLPLVLTSRDLCGDDRTEGIFEVSDRVACKDSISPLSDIVLGTLQYLRNLATYEFDGNKIKRIQDVYFPVCPSRTDLLLLVLLYIALSNSQQSSTAQTP